MKTIVLALIAALSFSAASPFADTLKDGDIDISAPSAVLTEKETGQVIYEKNAHERMPPASVTKVMTMLLIVEAIDSGELELSDTVTASERAASFGGSCVYLEEGEKMSVDEMLKCIAVVSANDCAVAMAEHMCGTEQAFVAKMNERAAELGMEDTHFTNCTGLFDDDEHYSTAYDIALMSKELISHELIKDYTTIWMDFIRNGEFGLTNTNKLVYCYDGCTGLKTGFTSLAMYCLSATAMRDGVEYIAVIMHADSVDKRNADAKTLLNYAFANYTVCPLRLNTPLPYVAVELGVESAVQPEYSGAEAVLIKKQGIGDLDYSLELYDEVAAPLSRGDELGLLRVKINGEEAYTVKLIASHDVPRMDFGDIFLSVVSSFLGIK